MHASTSTAAVSGKRLWAGRIVSTLPVLYLLLTGGTRALQMEGVLQWFAGLGYPPGFAVPTAILELVCTVIYVIPRTSVLGAVLLTGYLGGACASEVRIQDWAHAPLSVVCGLLVWGGLYLRERRLQSLVPLRSRNP
jgi:uncharacterized membrane protein YphA (DoxX/SURF4 family)